MPTPNKDIQGDVSRGGDQLSISLPSGIQRHNGVIARPPMSAEELKTERARLHLPSTPTFKLDQIPDGIFVAALDGSIDGWDRETAQGILKHVIAQAERIYDEDFRPQQAKGVTLDGYSVVDMALIRQIWVVVDAESDAAPSIHMWFRFTKEVATGDKTDCPHAETMMRNVSEAIQKHLVKVGLGDLGFEVKTDKGGSPWKLSDTSEPFRNELKRRQELAKKRSHPSLQILPDHM